MKLGHTPVIAMAGLCCNWRGVLKLHPISPGSFATPSLITSNVAVARLCNMSYTMSESWIMWKLIWLQRARLGDDKRKEAV